MILPFAEGLQPFRDLSQLSPLILISNAGVAFLLNVAAVFLIGVGSGLILTLAGVLKVTHSIASIYLPRTHRAHAGSGHYIDHWCCHPFRQEHHRFASIRYVND